MKVEFELIVALNQDGVIGINNKIPWYIPEDLQRFKKMTEGNIVIMGRKTYESLPINQRPLKNRLNIVLSRQKNIYDFEHDNLIFTTMDNIYDIIKENIFIEEGDDDDKKIKKKVFIIGGNEIYKLFINQCSIIHITEVIFNIDENIILKGDNTITYFLSLIDIFSKDKNEDYLLSKNENIKYRYIKKNI